VEDVPFDWYFSEEDIKVYGGTKIHPKDQLVSKDNLEDFQHTRVRYHPTELVTLRGKGNSLLISIYNFFKLFFSLKRYRQSSL